MRSFWCLSAAAVATTVAVPSWAQAPEPGSLSTPVGCEDCINWWYYVDHGGGNGPQDYDCQDSTYDGHAGTDYSLRGGNDAIADGNDVVAALAGVVIVSQDGNFDQCTSCGGSGCGVNTPGGGFANYVVIDHGGFSTTYGHMRNGSVLVAEGDTVECGQVLGQIGSAGCSSGAHLHFQPKLDSQQYLSNPLDPYVGQCSPTEASLWGEQNPHTDRDAPTPGHTCDDPGDPPVEQCPPEAFPIWTCNEDGADRRRCVNGVDTTESCEWGCAVTATDSDDECELPPDADDDGVRADTDCDDSRSDINPGAVDVCGDGVDQDCSGEDLQCAPDGSGGEPSSAGAPTDGGAGTVGVGVAGAGTSAGNGGANSGGMNSGGSSPSRGGTATAPSPGEPGPGAAPTNTVPVPNPTPDPSSSGLAPNSPGLPTTSPSMPTPSGSADDAPLSSDAEAGCGCTIGRDSQRTGEGFWLALFGLIAVLRGRGAAHCRATTLPGRCERAARLPKQLDSARAAVG